MIHTIPEEGLTFCKKPGLFGNPVIEVKILRDRYVLKRKKSDTLETIYFKDIKRIIAPTLNSSNGDYDITIFFDEKPSIDFTLDPTGLKGGVDTDNYIQTKACFTAYTQFVLGEQFPNNIDELDIRLSGNENSKKGNVFLTKGFFNFDGEKYPTTFLVSAKIIKGAFIKLDFYDGTTKNLKQVYSSITFTVIEAIMIRNTGEGIDFSEGDGFANPTSWWMRDRYIEYDTLRI